MHFAVGGFIATDPAGNNGAAGLMSDVTTAAFDPIFWAHHCNIDRLWSVWDCLPNRQWGSAPPAAWFTEKPWWFYDADGNPKNLERDFYMQAENLDIHFDTDKSTCRPLSARLPAGGTRLTSTVGNNETSAVTPAVRLERAEIGTVSIPLELSPTTPTTKNVPVTSETVFGAHAPKDALLEVPAGKVRRLLVELEGVDYKTVPAVSYQVYVNLPEGTAPTTESPNYVGSLGLFGIKHAEGRHNGGHNQVFDVTDIVKEQSGAEKSLKVTIVPAPLLVHSPSASGALAEVPIRDAHVTISGIHIVAIQVDASTTQ